MSEKFDIEITTPDLVARHLGAGICDECGVLVPISKEMEHERWHRRLEQILTLLGFNW
jgi:hypothetical protein